MDELGEKLAQILNDPESMNRVRKMAENLLSGQPAEQQAPENEPSMPSGDELKAIMGIITGMKKGGDTNTGLLLALRPHLSEPRQEKLDTAVKILRLLEVLPLVKETGLLNF